MQKVACFKNVNTAFTMEIYLAWNLHSNISELQ
ncbi:MAG: hypothetical protein K0Q87_325 [Neobacillus sp.]|jgi:hypothetical protein|nr:hypothetical protein [Neobacillus sp.]